MVKFHKFDLLIPKILVFLIACGLVIKSDNRLINITDIFVFLLLGIIAHRSYGKKTANNHLLLTKVIAPYYFLVVLLATGIVTGLVFSQNMSNGLVVIKDWYLVPIITAYFVAITPGVRTSFIYGLLTAFGVILIAKFGMPGLSSYTTSTSQMAVSLFLVLFPYLACKLGNLWRMLIGVLMLALFTGMSALSGCMGLIFQALVLYKKRFSRLAPQLLIVLLIFVLGMWLNWESMPQSIIEFVERISQQWHIAWVLIKTYPISGVGFLGYEFHYQRLVPNYYVDPILSTSTHPYNIFFQAWLSLGLAGLMGYLGIIWLVLTGNRNTFQLAIIGLVGQGIYSGVFFTREVCMLFWVLIALYVVNEHEGQN